MLPYDKVLHSRCNKAFLVETCNHIDIDDTSQVISSNYLATRISFTAERASCLP